MTRQRFRAAPWPSPPQREWGTHTSARTAGAAVTCPSRATIRAVAQLAIPVVVTPALGPAVGGESTGIAITR